MVSSKQLLTNITDAECGIPAVEHHSSTGVHLLHNFTLNNVIEDEASDDRADHCLAGRLHRIRSVTSQNITQYTCKLHM